MRPSRAMASLVRSAAHPLTPPVSRALAPLRVPSPVVAFLYDYGAVKREVIESGLDAVTLEPTGRVVFSCFDTNPACFVGVIVDERPFDEVADGAIAAVSDGHVLTGKTVSDSQSGAADAVSDMEFFPSDEEDCGARSRRTSRRSSTPTAGRDDDGVVHSPRQGTSHDCQGRRSVPQVGQRWRVLLAVSPIPRGGCPSAGAADLLSIDLLAAHTWPPRRHTLPRDGGFQ